jgi:uncharacterized protein
MMPRLFLKVVCWMIPRLIEPRKFAQQGLSVTGDLPSAELRRLSDAVMGLSDVQADLQFEVAQSKHRRVYGRVSAQATLECQRCLEPVELTLDAQVNLAIVWSEDDAKQLPDDLEPWVVTQEQADLYEILEEELLLALPLVPVHEHNCLDAGVLAKLSEPAPVPNKTNNPFQVLSTLKGSNKT